MTTHVYQKGVSAAATAPIVVLTGSCWDGCHGASWQGVRGVYATDEAARAAAHPGDLIVWVGEGRDEIVSHPK
jgi:hypothetical protein